jgi:ADP-heptose:LPS heptosyltransferase
MADPRFSILFITATRIGDAVLSSGLIRRLKEEIPHAHFTIAAGPLAAPLFQDVPDLDRVIAMPKAKSGMHWFDLWRAVHKRRWGLVVDMRGSGVARFLSAKRRAIRRSPPAALGPLHKVIEAARVLKLEDDPPAPFFFTSAAREAEADRLTAGEGPILALAPAANWVGKTWPAERFAVLAAELLGPRGPMPTGRLMILGGPDDRWACEAVRRAIPRQRTIDLVGRVDLLTAYACLKRARLFVGNDSGLMHLSAAAGAPTLGLFGPSDERLYGPWGENARALRGPRAFEAFVKIDPTLSSAVCHMLDLPADWVSRAARQLFQETAQPLLETSLPEPPMLDQTMPERKEAGE